MFGIFPVTVIHDILSYLQPKELASIARVNKFTNSETKIVAYLCIRKIFRGIYMSDAVLNTLDARLSSTSFTKFLHDLRKKQILVLNGSTKESSILDIKENKWKACSTDMLQHRAAFSAVWFRGELVIVSGNLPDTASGTVEKYNPFTDKWTSLPSLPEKLRYMTATNCNNQLYVIGGFIKETSSASNSIYRLDHGSWSSRDDESEASWTLLPFTLPCARYTHSAIGYEGKIWVAGGFPKPNSVVILDPITGDYFEGPQLKVRRAQFKLVVALGEIYAVGGDDVSSGMFTIEKFDERLHEWVIVTAQNKLRLMHSVTVASSKIYVFGGLANSNTALADWDAFNVRTGIWDSDEEKSLTTSASSFEIMTSASAETGVTTDVSDDDYYVGYDSDDDVIDIDIDVDVPKGLTSSSLSLENSAAIGYVGIETDCTRKPKMKRGHSMTSFIAPRSYFPRSAAEDCCWRVDKEDEEEHLSRQKYFPRVHDLDNDLTSLASGSTDSLGSGYTFDSISSSIKMTSHPSLSSFQSTFKLPDIFSSKKRVAGAPLLTRSLSGGAISSLYTSPLQQPMDFIQPFSPSAAANSKDFGSKALCHSRSNYSSTTSLIECKKRRKKSTSFVSTIDLNRDMIVQESAKKSREMPFPHAFGCAVYIPSVCFYS